MVRSEEEAILHLHGYWEEPESVVLGIRSYEQVLGDAHAQTMLRAVRATRGLLFVGCGAGIADPDFDALLRWMRTVFEGSAISSSAWKGGGEVAERPSKIDVCREFSRPLRERKGKHRQREPLAQDGRLSSFEMRPLLASAN